jgi:hypothetical protein
MIILSGAISIKMRLAFLAVLVAILCTGCGAFHPPEPSAIGSLYIAADMTAVSAMELEDAVVELTLTKNKSAITMVCPVTGGSASFHLDNLLIGSWEISMSLRDIDGDVTYTASGLIDIMPEETSTVSVTLQPKKGILEVRLDPDMHGELTASQKARLNVNPGGYATLALNEDGLLVGKKELAPGDYDYSLAFYADSFLVGELIYETPWQTVVIKPGKSVVVFWEPGSGTALIEGSVDNPPPAPEGVALHLAAEGLLITWNPVNEPDIRHYRVYLRQSVFDKFDEVTETNADQTTYLHPASKLTLGCPVEVVVTAVDAAGQESRRSLVVILQM